MRLLALSAALLLISGESRALEPAVPFHEPNAVLINISKTDLNRIVRDAFRANVGPRIEGTKTDLSRGIQDLRYVAGFSEPILELNADGRVEVDVKILDAEVRIGRLERRFMKRLASCDEAGVDVRPGEPVAVRISLRFEVSDHDLRIVPEDVTLENTKGFRIVKPTKCRNTLVPKWLLWWIGKGKLRKKIEALDEVLLAKAHEGAAELNDGDGFLAHHWSLEARDGTGRHSDIYLYPQSVDTSHDSLLVGLAGSTTPPRETSTALPDWTGPMAVGSFVGLSESFLNASLRAAMTRIRTRPRAVGGSLSKVLHSSAALSLIPGLRELESRDDLRFGLAFHTPPRIEFVPADDGDTENPDAPARALIRLRLAGTELSLWGADDDEPLGTVRIDSAVLTVAPYLNLLGGVSFETIENRWELSSHGLEFDEAGLAATLQELFFGEMFQTTYDPVGRDSLELGETRFNPRYFSLLGNYLVIRLSGL